MAVAGGLAQILFTESRDFLLDKEGMPVKKEAVEGKVVGLLICSHRVLAPFKHVISLIEDACKELQGRAIAFVYVTLECHDKIINDLKMYGQTLSHFDARPEEECFADSLKKLPEGCLAVPFEDRYARTRIAQAYKSDIYYFYTLAFVGPDGRLHSNQGFALLEKWGAEGYPFHDDRIAALLKAAQEKRAHQNLQVLLAREERDHLISSQERNQVKVAELEGKTVALFFSAHWSPECQKFTAVLASVYKELKEKRVEFEVVFISSDDCREAFEHYFKGMPWLAVPHDDKKTRKLLNDWFEVEEIPSLVILDKHGKTLNTEGMELVYKHGSEAYPFTLQRLQELNQAQAARRAAQTLETLLVTPHRDFLISNNGRIKVADLKGKTVALYFSAHWCPPCQKYTPVLVSMYKQLKDTEEEFEVVFISSDDFQLTFDNYFEGMPWLAVPYNDEKTRKFLNNWFEVEGIPTLVILDTHGKTLNRDGMELVYMHNVEEAKRASQTLETLLVTQERDFVLFKYNYVKVAYLKGKTVGLYFSRHYDWPCSEFTLKLKFVYDELKRQGRDFEVIFVSSDPNPQDFKKCYGSMPWLALPFKDNSIRSLSKYFGIEGIPQLVIIGPNGKTVTTNGCGLIGLHGADAFPFTNDRIKELKQAGSAAKRATYTLETLLVTEERDFVISKDHPVKVSSLMGKTVGLYFLGHWSPPCREFTIRLKCAYDKLKRRGEEFEVIFVSSDRDKESFEECYGSMPWLYLPFNDNLIRSLHKYFGIERIPQLVIIGPNGNTVTTDGCGLIGLHGADAFPFTVDWIATIIEKVQNLPKEVTSSKHEHPLTLTDNAYAGRLYSCDDCNELGVGWVYHCAKCGYDLHLDCIV